MQVQYNDEIINKLDKFKLLSVQFIYRIFCYPKNKAECLTTFRLVNYQVFIFRKGPENLCLYANCS